MKKIKSHLTINTLKMIGVSWIFPLTILPGIGMLIMSTTHWCSSLASEINESLNSQLFSKPLIKKKIRQLNLINRTLVLLYICTGLCAVAGFFGALCQENGLNGTLIMNILLTSGILVLVIATVMLIIFAAKATTIKQEQLEERLKTF